VPNEIAQAIPIVRVAVSGREKSTSVLCQLERQGDSQAASRSCYELGRGVERNIARTCMSCCCADWAVASPGTT
jgi:hypothetical protein